MRNRVLTALCLALCCALMIACNAEDAAETAAATAAPKAGSVTTLPKAELYAADNVPYAYVAGEYAPLLLSRDAIDSLVDAGMEQIRTEKDDAFDEEALRASLEAQVTISGDSYVPTIKPYLVENSKAAVILFPGGGYWKLSKKEEGGTVARAFNKQGISAFVVSYRVAPCDWRAILSDGQRAVRYVRWHAREFGIDPDRIAVCGFSQGGHLALMTCQHPEFEIDDPSYRRDAVDEVSGLPNACILCYGVATLEKGHTFEVGAEIFTHGDDSLRAAYSAENGVTPDMCPVFIWLNRDDRVVPPVGAFWLAEACAAQDVPYEMHVFGSGGHGCGLGKGLPCQKWLSLACSWLNHVL